MTEQVLGWTWVAKQLAVVKQTCFKCVLKKHKFGWYNVEWIHQLVNDPTSWFCIPVQCNSKYSYTLIQGKHTVLHLHSSHLKSFTGAQIVIIENIKKICIKCETLRADTWIVCFINEDMLRQPSALLSIWELQSLFEFNPSNDLFKYNSWLGS